MPFYREDMGEKPKVIAKSLLDTALTVGDEPLEIFQTIQKPNKEKGSQGPRQEFSNSLLSPVLVCENRIHGLSLIQKHNPTIKLVLLDDGFQHLQLSAHGKIILTKFEDPSQQTFLYPREIYANSQLRLNLQTLF